MPVSVTPAARRWLALGCLSLSYLSAAPLAAEEGPRAWLERMINTVRFSTYEGTKGLTVQFDELARRAVDPRRGGQAHA